MASALVESAADSDRLALARAFGSRLISAWWRRVFGGGKAE